MSAPQFVAWTPLDRDSWKAVMSSPIGKKMLLVCRAAHYRGLNEGSKDRVYAENRVFRSHGFLEALEFIEALCVACDAQKQQENAAGSTGEPNFSEQNVESLEQMTRRLSP